MRRLRTMIASVGAAALIAVTGTGVLAAPANLASPAADLRVAINRLLGEHVFLAVQATRAGIDTGDLESAPFTAAAGALQGNTDELVAAIESIYGADAGQAFRAQWEAHIGFFVDYTVGVATDDQAMQDQAVEDLGGYIQDFGKFLSDATGGNLPVDAARASLQEHVNQLAGQVSAYAAGDYAEAYALETEAYSHMFMTGDALSLAIIQQQGLAGNDLAWSPAVDLEIALVQGFGQHAVLAIEATRAGVSGAADFEAAAAELQANTDALVAAIESVYGGDAAQAFRAQWEAHIGFFVDYTVATAGGDEAARQQAAEDLGTYVQDFGAFLGTATAENLPTDAARTSLEQHVSQLAGQVDQYFAEDYEAAYASEREAYSHMVMTAQAIAAAIAGQFPSEFPVAPTPSDTALEPVAGLTPITAAGLALLGLATAVVARRAATEVTTR